MVRKVLPAPPLDENTDMIRPRSGTGSLPSATTLTERRFVAHTMARSTASRSSSLPWVMSTTSRMPARIAAGQQAVPRVVAHQHDRRARRLTAHELGESEGVGLLDLGRQDQDVDRVEGVDQELFGRGGGLNPAHLLELDLERSRELLAERLRRPDGDDAWLIHGQFFPNTRSSGITEKGRGCPAVSFGGSRPIQIGARLLGVDEVLRIRGARSSVRVTGWFPDWLLPFVGHGVHDVQDPDRRDQGDGEGRERGRSARWLGAFAICCCGVPPGTNSGSRRWRRRSRGRAARDRTVHRGLASTRTDTATLPSLMPRAPPCGASPVSRRLRPGSARSPGSAPWSSVPGAG